MEEAESHYLGTSKVNAPALYKVQKKGTDSLTAVWTSNLSANAGTHVILYLKLLATAARLSKS